MLRVINEFSHLNESDKIAFINSIESDVGEIESTTSPGSATNASANPIVVRLHAKI